MLSLISTNVQHVFLFSKFAYNYNMDNDEQGTKICRNCGEEKSIELFPHFSAGTTGRKNTCRECTTTLNRLRKLLKEDHPVPEPGPCPICGRHTENWILDHCHFTNDFRGYICNGCNLGMGHFNDDVKLLKKAIKYLEGK